MGDAEANLVDVPCPYLEGSCGMPVEVVDVRTFHSSDPSGHTLVVNYRCLSGHRWHDAGPAEPIGEEMYG